MEVPSTSTGVVSLDEYCKHENVSKESEHLRACGLSSDEIKLYQDYKKGHEFLDIAHKNIEKTVLAHKLQDVLDKVTQIQNIDSGTDESAMSQLVKDDMKYSIDPNFHSKGLAVKPIIRSTHPINHLPELEEDIFGHMTADDLPTATKRCKILRRMERKFAKAIPLPEPNFVPASSQESQHSYNDFIKVNTNNASQLKTGFKPFKVRKPNSKWDIKDMDSKLVPKIAQEQPKEIKKIGCVSQSLYTIKDNRIVRLEPKTVETDKTKKRKALDFYNAVELKVPINKAEEKLLEGTKLTLEDIRKLPKFLNYEMGELSNILFVKNLSDSIDENDLKSLFKINETAVNIRLMVGRMKGQAFITFQTPEIARKVLEDKNGTIVKGKPVIIQFGKKGNG